MMDNKTGLTYSGAARITVIFLVVSVLYIVFSDKLLLVFLNENAGAEGISIIQTYKGIGFVLITSALIFFLIRSELKRKNFLIAEAENRRRETESMTERYRLLNQELTERNKFIEVILDNLSIGVAINLVNEGTSIYMNRAFSAIYGWPPEELISIDGFFEKVYPDSEYREKIRKMVSEDIAGGNPDQMHWENVIITGQSGEKRIVNASNIPVFDQNLMISTVMDITDLQRTIEDKNMLFNYSSDMICIAGFDGYFKTLNPAWEKSLGWTEKELCSKPFIKFVHPEDINSTKERLKRLKTGDDTGSFVNRYITKDDDYRYFSWNSFALEGENKIFSIVRDITGIIEKEKEIEAYQRSLQDLTIELTLSEEKQRREMAANIHDNLSQSLVIARMKLSGLKTDSGSGVVDDTIKTVIRHLSEALESSRNITYDLSPPVLYELGLKEAVLWLAGKTGSEYNLQVETSLNIGDISFSDDVLILIFRTVRELVFNVVKHAQASMIKIDMNVKEGKLYLKISDNGAGFEPDSFGQRRKNKGFGLFKVKERMNNLNGGLSIDTAPGKGTRVEFFLPVD
ncbi:MAG: PAS domain S-box protein [Bacteroidales bacterium]|nr:PAS domain S-box protein [Bacteroidales bacterium]